MDRMLVVVFDTEAKAVEGSNALLQLDDEGILSLYDHAIIEKHADGTTTVKQADDLGPLGTLAGSELGSLIGLLSGPAGLAMGAAVGFLAGAALDIHHANVNDEFIDDVSKELQPGKFAVVAQVQEDETTPVDTHMEPLGGVVFRRTLSDVKHALHEEHIAAMKAAIAQMKAEQAVAHADRKARLQEKINRLDSKIQEQLRRSNERREEAELAEKAKAEALEEAAAKEAKAAETPIVPGASGERRSA
jgi:uncharacterized membrane protein